MKKNGVVCLWKCLKKKDGTEERSIQITYYEYHSLNSNDVNNQQLTVKKVLTSEEWDIFRQDDIFPDFFGEEFAQIWT